MNIFDTAKNNQEEKKVKDNGKVRVAPDVEGLFETIETMEQLQKQMKSAKAKYDMLADEVKDISKDEFVKLFENDGKYPGSFMVEAKDGEDIAQVMYVPTDRYKKVNKTRAEQLKDKYGDDIVTEDTTFAFNSKLLAKYGEVISKLITECDDIEAADKAKLITATTKYSVAKGTIEKLDNYGDVEEMLNEVNPVVQLKGAEVIKG